MLKLIYILFISSVLGCSTTSKITHEWPNDNKVVTADSVKKDIPTETTVTPSGNEKKVLKLALLLPFYTNEIEFDSLGISVLSVSDKSKLALQYLRGVQMALDSLDHAGVKIEMNIYDTQKDTDRVKSFMSTVTAKETDAFIGPISNNELTVAGKLIDPKHQVIFSPLSASYSIATNNAGFVLTNAGLKTHCEQLAAFINQNYPAKKIIMLYRRNETESVYATYFKSILKSKVLELTEKSDSSFYHVDDFLTVIDNNIVIIPSFDEEFINLLSKKLFELTDNYKITLFGMPTWIDMETLRLDYLQKLNTHITGSFYANDSLKNFMIFRDQFKQEYSSRPDEYSYKGYNLVLQIGNLWKQYGNKWFEHIEETYSGLGVNYKFQPVALNGNTATDFIENKSVYVLLFKNNHLIKVK